MSLEFLKPTSEFDSNCQSYLQEIRNILRNFTRLRILRINCIDYWQMGDIKCQLDRDFATVTEWGESCASLVEITLPRECHRSCLEYFIH